MAEVQAGVQRCCCCEGDHCHCQWPVAVVVLKFSLPDVESRQVALVPNVQRSCRVRARAVCVTQGPETVLPDEAEWIWGLKRPEQTNETTTSGKWRQRCHVPPEFRVGVGVGRGGQRCPSHCVSQSTPPPRPGGTF